MSGRSRYKAACTCVTHCSVALRRGPSALSMDMLGGEPKVVSAHAWGGSGPTTPEAHEVKPHAPSLTRASAIAEHRTRAPPASSTPDAQPQPLGDGAMHIITSLEQLEVVRSGGSCHSSGGGDRRRLPGDGPSRNARVAADKRERRTRKRTASQ